MVIDTFLVVLIIIGIVPFGLLVYFLVDLLTQPVYTFNTDKKPSKFEEFDNIGFEQISMPKRGK